METELMKFLYIEEMVLEMIGNASGLLAPEDTTVIMKIKYTKTKKNSGVTPRRLTSKIYCS